MELMSLSGIGAPVIIHSFVDPKTGKRYGRGADGNIYVYEYGVNGLGLLPFNISSIISKAIAPVNPFATANSVVSKLLSPDKPVVPAPVATVLKPVVSAPVSPVLNTFLQTAPKAIVQTLVNANTVPADWDDALYLEMNQDVANAVSSGQFSSGWQHYNTNGRSEGRTYASKTLRAQRDKDRANAQAAEAARVVAAAQEALQAKAKADALALEAKNAAIAAAQATVVAQNQAQVAVTAQDQAQQVQTLAVQATAPGSQVPATTNPSAPGLNKNVLIIGGAVAVAAGFLLLQPKKKASASLSGLPRSTPRKRSRKTSGAAGKRAASKPKRAVSRTSTPKLGFVNFN